MALDPSRRSSICRKLVPLLGSEDAYEVMNQISSHEPDALVTKDFLRAALRAELLALETRLTIRLGAASAAIVAVLASLRLFP